VTLRFQGLAGEQSKIVAVQIDTKQEEAGIEMMGSLGRSSWFVHRKKCFQVRKSRR
jgi:hypothetical protein